MWTTSKITAICVQYLLIYLFTLSNEGLHATNTAELTKDLVNTLKMAFTALDVNKDGFIPMDEIPFILKMVNIRINEEVLKDLLEETDVDRNGQLDFNEFLKSAERFLTKKNPDTTNADPEEIFELYDYEGKGYITKSDLGQILFDMDDISTNDMYDLVTQFDTDENGTINFKEFLNAMIDKVK